MTAKASVKTLLDVYRSLRSHLAEMQKVALQAVAHRKKFQLFLYQFSRFLVGFKHNVDETSLTSIQQESYFEILGIIRECHDIFSQNFLHCWAHTIIDNPSSQTATDLCSFVSRLRNYCESLDPQACNCFNPADTQWLQFHILDLKAITTSFNQYITSPSPNPEIVQIMNEKLVSINQFLEKYDTEDLISGSRVFSPIPINYQIWRIQHNDFVEEQEAGSGGLAIVYYGHYKPTGEEVAIKKLKFTKLSSAHLQVFQREVIILATAEHPTLLRFVGATDTLPFCILTEWMPGGSLFQELHDNHRLDQTQLTICAIDIARGMAYLHSMQIIHRDLKSLNVLLDKDGNAKICDFGFSRTKTKDEETMTQNIGTPHWMAPEILGGSTTYNEKIDVYAYGIVLWEILTKKLPYSGLEATMIIGQVLLNDLRPAIPPNTPPKLAELIEACWQRDANARPTFAEILKLWRSGDILYPGTDHELIMKHLESTLDEKERACSDVESHLSSTNSYDSEQHSNDIRNSLKDFAETLLRDGIPDELVDRCWENLMKFRNSELDKSSTYIQLVVLFLKTTAASRALSTLRKMAPGSVPKSTALDILMLLPTGDASQDDDIIMIACKSGAASEAAVHALQNRHLKIAFEIISRQGVNPEVKDLVIERCLRCLGVFDVGNKTVSLHKDNPIFVSSSFSRDSVSVMRNDFLSVSAIRCLIANDAINLLPIDLIQRGIGSRNMTLRECCFIAMAKIVNDGAVLNNDSLEMILSQTENNNQFAGIVIINAAKNVESAKFILNKLKSSIRLNTELEVRILIQIAKHQELRNEVKSSLEQLNLSSISDEVEQAVKKLDKIVSI